MKYVANVGLWFSRGFLVFLLFLFPASIFLTVGLSSETYTKISQSIILLDNLQKQASTTLKATNESMAGNSSTTMSNGDIIEVFSQMMSQSSQQGEDAGKVACTQQQVSALIAEKATSSQAGCQLSYYDKSLIDHQEVSKDYKNLQNATQATYQFQNLDENGQPSKTALALLKLISILRMSLLIVIMLLVFAVAGLYVAVGDPVKFMRALGRSLMKVGIILGAYALVSFVIIKMHLLSSMMDSEQFRSIEDAAGPYTLTGVQINMVIGIVYIALAIAFSKLSHQIAQYQKSQDILRDSQAVIMYNKSHD